MKKRKSEWGRRREKEERKRKEALMLPPSQIVMCHVILITAPRVSRRGVLIAVSTHLMMDISLEPSPRGRRRRRFGRRRDLTILAPALDPLVTVLV